VSDALTREAEPADDRHDLVRGMAKNLTRSRVMLPQFHSSVNLDYGQGTSHQGDVVQLTE